MANTIAYEGISWAIGSTSFRTKELNKKTEWQLVLLDEFWRKPEFVNQKWKANEFLQQAYYKHLWTNDFTVGNASRPAKDAREKTSGLCDIGVVDRETRKLTEVGEELLLISKSNNFKGDNILQIDSDSFLYLKQLIKTSVDVGTSKVRPFIILARVLNELKYLTDEEFVYLLPLISDEASYKNVIGKIKDFRKGECDINQTIYEILLSHNSYKQAHDLLLDADSVTEDLIITIMMNRKSPMYSKPFFLFFKALHKVLMGNDFSEKSMKILDKSISDCKTTKTTIRQILYCTTKNIINGGKNTFRPEVLKSVKSEESFRELFFKVCHVSKTLNNLEDYGDLNLRYFTMSDCLITEDQTIKFDTLPKIYFSMVNDSFKAISFSDSDLLYKSVELKDIASVFEIDSELFYRNVAKEVGSEVYDRKSIQIILDKKKYARFNKLVDEKFTDAVLLQILDEFKLRETSDDEHDEKIKQFVSSNSDGPTSFEYILGIIWYKLNGRTGDVLRFMNLSLDGDLLPKTHAGGGEADIVWEYPESENYPEHTLLIEATLADRQNQRRMEMEPVSRHVGEYCLANKSKTAYGLFITPYLNPNVINDFFSRRNMNYFSVTDTNQFVKKLLIASLETDNLKKLIEEHIEYDKIYSVMQDYFSTDERNPLKAQEVFVDNLIQ